MLTHLSGQLKKRSMQYRSLTFEEIETLEKNSCWAEDWNRVEVSEDGFQAKFFHRVMFYGDIRLGCCQKNVEITKDFFKHSGINDATLRNVTVGNDCLIEKVGNYINNYTIGDDCLISNISVMETTEGASYGEGNLISVLNEVGDGNVILFHDLNSQFAAFMVKHFNDKDLKNAIRRLVSEEITRTNPERGTIGNNVKIVNTKEITNTVIQDDCEISGASRLSDCTILSSENASVYIGTGVICENSIISDGSSIVNSVKMQDCFVGEACQIANGFTASQSVFFANSFMANGEACAAFCGPFCASHHKSSLLIGGMFSFYNAGSGTNFSNHAYKMGPMHWGILERGTKTASGSYLLMPATIGTFSVCFGKLMHHPNTTALPFSYLIAEADKMFLVPGRNITVTYGSGRSGICARSSRRRASSTSTGYRLSPSARFSGARRYLRICDRQAATTSRRTTTTSTSSTPAVCARASNTTTSHCASTWEPYSSGHTSGASSGSRRPKQAPEDGTTCQDFCSLYRRSSG